MGRSDKTNKEIWKMTEEEMINRLKDIQEQYPENSTAYQALDMAISKLNTNTTAEWKQHLMNRFERM